MRIDDGAQWQQSVDARHLHNEVELD
jgi:hypothetical protein